MDIKELKYLEICQKCGCVFSRICAETIFSFSLKNKIFICPACAHEHEAKRKITK